MPIPTSERFINELGYRLCIQAGYSWVSDDGAQDAWKCTALEYAIEANKVERWQREADGLPPNSPFIPPTTHQPGYGDERVPAESTLLGI
jgi:hypothetical protein